jgi:hypothetical protein
MKEMYYKPSGKFSPLFILLFVVFMAIAIPILSVVYIYAVYYIPVVYFNIFIAVFCGVGLGFAVMFSTQLGKSRNRILVIVLTILAVVLLKYTQWCIYIPLVYSEVYEVLQTTFIERLSISAELFFQPDTVFSCAAEINEFGAWSLGSRTSSASSAVNGVFLLVIWILEFLVIMIGALVVSSNKVVFPFSENSQAWYKDIKTEIDTSCPADPNAFKANLEMGSFGELIALVQQGKTNEFDCLGVHIYEPPQSGSMEPYYLSIFKKTIAVDKKGRHKATRTLLIRFIAADSRTVATIRQPYPQQTEACVPVNQ